MGANPEAADNRWLREAMQNRIPLIYFLGAFPGHYQAIIPVTIVGWDASSLRERDPDGRRGFFRLPAPDPGDVFFDMEGDPLEEDGLEYLFGVRYLEGGVPRFRPFWAHDRGEEKLAFEAFMDFIAERRRAFPGMHVYHYAPYEPTALKRLMSMHGTRENEVNDLLRGRVLVDLYAIVREAMRTSEPGLSIKDIECFYMQPREGAVLDAGSSIVFYERWRVTKDPAELEAIERYNGDDCRSTHLLRDWLLTLRPAGMAWFTPEVLEEAKAEEKSERTRKIEAELARMGSLLLDGSEDPLRQLTADLLDFHRRCANPEWWAVFARQDMTTEELVEDYECLGGLVSDGKAPVPVDRSLLYGFNYPEQDTKLRVGSECLRADTGKAFGTIEALDEAARHVVIRVWVKREVPATFSIGPGGPINTDKLRDAVWRFAQSVIAGDGRFATVKAFLRKKAPTPDESYLFIQGPPGAGKTTTGSQRIVELLRDGRRVGVTSNSHKAINNLLSAVVERAQKVGFNFRGVKKNTSPEDQFNGPMIEDVNKNEKVVEGDYQLVAGTAWLFADPALEASLDYLFVDEAGQVSLANLVAAGTSARNIVLLGDQMQLGQPIQGAHPGRSGESTLDYLLDGAATVPEGRGIFLATTWRMHPDICRFISDAVYDGRLEAEAANSRQRLVLAGGTHPALKPTGICFVPVVHDGCAQRSAAEAEVVKELVESLLGQSYEDKTGERHPMTLAEILVVAPYNAQVNLLRATLPQGARVGTIDKFQGQQAQAVIVSMTTSSGEFLPRNIRFLFDRNRLNVAVSRAKCLSIVIASPELLRVKCSSAEEMELVNTLCWLKEYSEGEAPVLASNREPIH